VPDTVGVHHEGAAHAGDAADPEPAAQAPPEPPSVSTATATATATAAAAPLVLLLPIVHSPSPARTVRDRALAPPPAAWPRAGTDLLRHDGGATTAEGAKSS